MKKIIIIFFSISFSFAYAQEKEDYKKTESTYIQKLTIPEFTDPDIQEFAEEYTGFINEYITAVKEDNTKMIYEIGEKIQKIADKTNEIMTKFEQNPEDAEKFSQYAQSLVDEMKKALSNVE